MHVWRVRLCDYDYFVYLFLQMQSAGPFHFTGFFGSAFCIERVSDFEKQNGF